jgi:hypothetical protein
MRLSAFAPVMPVITPSSSRVDPQLSAAHATDRPDDLGHHDVPETVLFLNSILSMPK